MARRKKKIVQDILITGIGDKGQAIGRDEEGVVYFVKGAVPGDVVDVLVKRHKSSFRKGIVANFKSYSPERVEAFCEHFGNCGGCKWQYLSYESQLKYKETVVLDAFKRIGHLDVQKRDPILACTQTTEYRNKMEYSFSHRRWVPQAEIDKGEEVDFGKAAGLHPAGAFDKVVRIEKCYLQEDLGNQIRNFIHDLATTKEWTYYNSREHEGFLRNMKIRNTSLGDWMVIVIFGEKNMPEIEFLMKSLVDKFEKISSAYYVINQKMNDSVNDQVHVHYHGSETIIEQLGHIKYKIGPLSFFQTNTGQANKLYERIKEIADLKGDEVVYDLYTGLGSIALYLADQCKTVIGVEEIKEAIDDAKINMELNSIKNAEFEVGDCKSVFNEAFVSKYGQADLIIVDPPRAGLHADVVAMLLRTNVSRIIYVSCNPSTQARDIALMAEHYEVAYLQPVDMFPHTHHIENITLLKKK